MSLFAASGWAVALILLYIVLFGFRGKAVRMQTLTRRPEKEPVDALTARLEVVTTRLTTATQELQETVEALRNGAPPRDGQHRPVAAPHLRRW